MSLSKKDAFEIGREPVAHYDESYFQWQNDGAALGAELNKQKFLPFLKSHHRVVLDFGCGGGSLLHALPAETRIGIEINPIARAHAQGLGIKVFSSLIDIPSESVDAVISNHALEHVEDPLGSLRQITRILRPGGTAVIVVPCDRAAFPFSRDDRDFHLFSWSEGNLGNLASAAGLEIIHANEIVNRWPPGWKTIDRIAGRFWLNVICLFWGYIRRSRSQVRVVANKPN